MQHHPWITNDDKEPCNWASDVEYVTFDDWKPSTDELSKAMSKVDQIKNVVFKKK